MFHQVFQRHVSPPIRRRQEPELPELWQPFCDGYEVSSHGRVRSQRQFVLINWQAFASANLEKNRPRNCRTSFLKTEKKGRDGRS